jgi:hypothetical protein
VTIRFTHRGALRIAENGTLDRPLRLTDGRHAVKAGRTMGAGTWGRVRR